MRKLLMLLLCIPMWGFAQNKTVENLKKELSAATADTVKSDLYYKIALGLQSVDPAASQKMAEKSLAIAQKNGYYKGVANYYAFVTVQQQNIITKLTLVKNEILIAMVVGLLVALGLFVALLYNRNQLKQKALLQAQMLNSQEMMTKAVIDAEEHERKRIAVDLHDGVGQLFSAVKMNLVGLFDRLKIEKEEDRHIAENIMALVDESYKEVRVISHQMMPNVLLRAGIASDLKSFIEKIDADKLKINLDAQGFSRRLENNVETMLYRIIQETINNVIKHAQATQLDIDLNHNNSVVKATIKDNGVGFDTDNRESFDGIGLKNIMTRIEYLKGNIAYRSSPGKGTTVSILIPLA